MGVVVGEGPTPRPSDMATRGHRRQVPPGGRLGHAKSLANLRNGHEAVATDQRAKLLAAAIYNLDRNAHGTE